MTLCAAAAAKQSLSSPGIAGLFKEAHGIEVSEQVCRGLLVHFAGVDAPLAHGGPHSWRVVPHGGGQRGRSEVPVHEAAQVGADARRLSVYGMTLNAFEGFEQPRTARRIHRNHGRTGPDRRGQ